MARQRANIIVRLAVLCVAVFLVFSAVNMQFRLGELRKARRSSRRKLPFEDRLFNMQLRLDEPVTDEYTGASAREKSITAIRMKYFSIMIWRIRIGLGG